MVRGLPKATQPESCGAKREPRSKCFWPPHFFISSDHHPLPPQPCHIPGHLTSSLSWPTPMPLAPSAILVPHLALGFCP